MGVVADFQPAGWWIPHPGLTPRALIVQTFGPKRDLIISLLTSFPSADLAVARLHMTTERALTYFKSILIPMLSTPPRSDSRVSGAQS